MERVEIMIGGQHCLPIATDRTMCVTEGGCELHTPVVNCVHKPIYGLGNFTADSSLSLAKPDAGFPNCEKPDVGRNSLNVFVHLSLSIIT